MQLTPRCSRVTRTRASRPGCGLTSSSSSAWTSDQTPQRRHLQPGSHWVCLGHNQDLDQSPAMWAPSHRVPRVWPYMQ